MSLIVKQAKKNSSPLKSFESKELQLSDIAHYGRTNPYERNLYKFVAYLDKKIVGILDLKIEANVAYIDNLLTGVEHRGKGIGKQLVLRAEEFAKTEKCTKIWLDTDEEWEAAKFYKKIGYQVTGTHENHYFGKRALIFTKFL